MANRSYPPLRGMPAECLFCHRPFPTVGDPADRSLAISVMDHRNKFQGSSILSMWFEKYGGQQPEQVFPDLEGFDIEAHFAQYKGK